MAKHENFYETVAEANIRLRGTWVLYDGELHYVHAISNHKQDGIFRIYMQKTGEGNQALLHLDAVNQFPSDHPSLGGVLDEYIETKGASCKLLRKMANSSFFNKFRPFPLGNCNWKGGVVYLERSPCRQTCQGLSAAMVSGERLLPSGNQRIGNSIDYSSKQFADTVSGSYPSALSCLNELKNPSNNNDGVAFHRLFSFLKGPLGIIFVSYKADIFGYLPYKNFSKIVIGPEFAHLKEVVTELGLFNTIAFE